MNDAPLIAGWKVAVVAVASVALAGAGVYGLTTIKEPEPERGECPKVLESARGTIDANDLGVAHVLVLIDPASNDSAEARMIGRQLDPIISPYLESGLTLEVLIDPGVGAVSTVSECLDGSSVFAVRNANDVRQRRDLTLAAKTVVDLIESMVASTQVAETGGPVALLRHAPKVGDPGSHSPGRSVVVLWSDLLANDGSCLDPEGAEGSEEVAEAVVARCVAVGAAEPIEADVILLAVGGSSRSAGFQYWADLVGDTLCDVISGSGDCGP